LTDRKKEKNSDDADINTVITTVDSNNIDKLYQFRLKLRYDLVIFLKEISYRLADIHVICYTRVAA